MSGIEIVSVALAVFPLVISLLEHYQDGYDTLRDFAHFRREFTHLVNELNREQIIFRQHVEGTLRSIIDSEYELKEMMDDAGSERWKNPDLAWKLQQKLCGHGEYENYQSSMWAIHDNLASMSKRLKAFETSPESSAATAATAVKGHRLQQRFRKLQFVMRKKKWRQHIIDLGRQIDRVDKLFGEAEALAPARQSRGSVAQQTFGHAKSQASSLHRAIVKTLACACSTPHTFKLIMGKPSKSSTPFARILKVSFPLCSRSWAMSRTALDEEVSWHSFDTTMASPAEFNRPPPTNFEFSGSQSSILSSFRDSQSPLLSPDSASTRTDITTPASSTCPSYFVRNRPTSSGELAASAPSTASGRPDLIDDLCSVLRTRNREISTGYINDGQGSYHILTTDPVFSFTSAEINHVISLKTVLTDQESTSEHKITPVTGLSRRHRMTIALTLAYALLELYPTPWMPKSLSKTDIYFFHKKDGTIMTDNPFFLCESTLPQRQQLQQQEQRTAATDDIQSGPVDDSNALLALGIVIMELWFGQTIESRSFYKDHCDACGNEKAFTSFTAALEWQRKAIDEAGVTFHDITNRCIRGNFGESTMDLSRGSCVRAVHDQVVKPLERMLGYIWPTKQAV